MTLTIINAGQDTGHNNYELTFRRTIPTERSSQQCMVNDLDVDLGG